MKAGASCADPQEMSYCTSPPTIGVCFGSYAQYLVRTVRSMVIWYRKVCDDAYSLDLTGAIHCTSLHIAGEVVRRIILL